MPNYQARRNTSIIIKNQKNSNLVKLFIFGLFLFFLLPQTSTVTANVDESNIALPESFIPASENLVHITLPGSYYCKAGSIDNSSGIAYLNSDTNLLAFIDHNQGTTRSMSVPVGIVDPNTLVGYDFDADGNTEFVYATEENEYEW
ncbi:MAG: hypothetical protein BAJATHORv1_80001 [Candidatus Thorarchaeota archaeon]|nr:MAG: hypothetical protein BAJATHORv1_80001 [Candidatus Thorarchaeota archaeon]